MAARAGSGVEMTRAVHYRLVAHVNSSPPESSREKRPMTKPELSKIIAAAIVMSAAAAMMAVVGPAFAQNLPNGNGRDAVQMICTGCHDLSPITDAAGFSRQDWEPVVKSMI